MSSARSHTVSSLLSPALAAAALTVFLASCSSSTSADTDTNSSVSMEETSSNDAMTDAASSAAMMNASSTNAMMQDTSSQSSSDATMTSSAPSSTQADAQGYKNGTFAATGNYRSPAGIESIEVSVTLNHNTITDASVVSDATNPRSQMMQANFIAGFKQQVVGKSIDSLLLGVVNGSSLTPLGFMDALAKIKAEAKA